MKHLILALPIAVLLSSCWGFGKAPEYQPKKVMGYKPVYSNDVTLLRPKSMGPQPFKFPGKIYVKDNLIFQNDIGSGIHVIDNSNPADVKPIGFIELRGSSEISIKGQYLYSNSFTDLVVVDIGNWQQASEVKRIYNAFQQGASVTTPSGDNPYNFIPLPEHNVYYECPFSYTGNGSVQIQTGWVKDSVYENSCFYP